MVFNAGDECDQCHKIFECQSTFDKHRKNYQCYQDDNESTQTTCGNNFQINIFWQTGKTLFHATDQVGESVHHSVDQFIDCHPNNNHTDKSAEEYGEDILNGIKHLNANNISSIW